MHGIRSVKDVLGLGDMGILARLNVAPRFESAGSAVVKLLFQKKGLCYRDVTSRLVIVPRQNSKLVAAGSLHRPDRNSFLFPGSGVQIVGWDRGIEKRKERGDLLLYVYGVELQQLPAWDGISLLILSAAAGEVVGAWRGNFCGRHPKHFVPTLYLCILRTPLGSCKSLIERGRGERKGFARGLNIPGSALCVMCAWERELELW